MDTVIQLGKRVYHNKKDSWKKERPNKNNAHVGKKHTSWCQSTVFRLNNWTQCEK